MQRRQVSFAASRSLPPIPVGVIKITERPTHPQLSFVGRVEATDSVDLIARVDGFLDKRTFTEGQAVKTGDLLFVLQKDALQAALDAAQANLAKAQADADNLKLQTECARSLYKQKTVSQAMLDDRVAAEKQALAVVQQAQASLERAQINLGYTDIRAPFSGRIGMANFSVGALVGPSSGPLATIVSQGPDLRHLPRQRQDHSRFNRRRENGHRPQQCSRQPDALQRHDISANGGHRLYRDQD